MAVAPVQYPDKTPAERHHGRHGRRQAPRNGGDHRRGRLHRRGDRPAVCSRGLHCRHGPAEWRKAGAADRGNRGIGRARHREIARRARRGAGRGVPGRCRWLGTTRNLHFQRGRERPVSVGRHHCARVPQGLGNGVLRGVSGGARGGAADAAARARRDLLHRRNRRLARRERLCGLRQRQVRAARGGASGRARAWPARHPCGAPRHRCRGRYRLGA